MDGGEARLDGLKAVETAFNRACAGFALLRAEAPPSRDFERLFAMISRSQHSARQARAMTATEASRLGGAARGRPVRDRRRSTTQAARTPSA